ncbi:MAG: GNAT family N-acetyltransferase [bacterium]|nr:GNAT family N-acetyltransferase [bacterium]
MPDHVLDNLSLDKRRENWMRAVHDPNRINFLYEENARILGFISYGPSCDEDANASITAELIALYVYPQAWRRGIGHSLWQHVELVLENNFKEITLWVIQNNHRARHYYEAMGFLEETGKKRLLPWYDCELYEVRYRKPH